MKDRMRYPLYTDIVRKSYIICRVHGKVKMQTPLFKKKKHLQISRQQQQSIKPKPGALLSVCSVWLPRLDVHQPVPEHYSNLINTPSSPGMFHQQEEPVYSHFPVCQTLRTSQLEAWIQCLVLGDSEPWPVGSLRVPSHLTRKPCTSDHLQEEPIKVLWCLNWEFYVFV